MLNSYSTRLQAIEKEKVVLADILSRVDTQLQDIANNMQASDQRTKELIGLIKWAGDRNGGEGSSSGLASSKVKIFTDPGTYNGSSGKFKDW